MLDTSAINRIHDGEVCAGEWTLRGPIFVTDIQIQEIAQTPVPERRASLLLALLSLRPCILRPGQISPSPYDLGFESPYDAGFTLDHDVYEPPLGRLIPHMAAALGSRIECTFRDAFIAEAARANELTLVTSDRKLAKMAEHFGVRVEAIH